MRNILKNRLLLAIFLIGLFLRFYKLDQIPNGFYVDEAVIGYNAYSFLLTGFRDEYGKLFPVFLRSFSAYSSPLYSYISVIFIKLFGLSVFSVRFLSALSGSLSVVALYAMVDKLFNRKRLSYISAFIFAISPWSIFFSRASFEANFSVLILLVSIIYLLKSRDKFNYFYMASSLLAINTYAYQTQRVISVFLMIIFSIIYLERKNIKKIFLGNLIFGLILIPQILLLNEPAFADRASGLFYIEVISQSKHPALGFLREFFAQYFNYFSPNNIFVRGDQDWQRSVPELSLFYSYLVIPYLLGIYLLLDNLKKLKYKILFLLFILFPIIPALTKDPFSSLRNLPSIIPVTIIIALGIDYLYKKINKYIFALVAFCLLAFSALYLWRGYFVLFPYERAKIWSSGYQELAQVMIDNKDKHYLVDTSRVKPPYILLAFHMKIDPIEMQNSVDPNIKNNYYAATEWDSYYKLANFETRSINWQEDIYNELVLVGDEFAISEDQANEHFLEKEFEIITIDKQIVFVGYKTNPRKKCESINFDNEFCSE